MLISQLGDLTSSAEHRVKKTIAGGSATNRAPAAVHTPQAALNLEKAGASLALRSGPMSSGLASAIRSAAAATSGPAPPTTNANAIRNAAAALFTPAPPKSPIAPSSLIANAIRSAAANMTFTPATSAAAAAAATPVTPTPAAAPTTSALTATPSGGGGGGGGGGDDLAPADDTNAVPAPTGWAALSISTKVIIVAGVAGVAFLGYKALRRR